MRSTSVELTVSEITLIVACFQYAVAMLKLSSGDAAYLRLEKVKAAKAVDRELEHTDVHGMAHLVKKMLKGILPEGQIKELDDLTTPEWGF